MTLNVYCPCLHHEGSDVLVSYVKSLKYLKDRFGSNDCHCATVRSTLVFDYRMKPNAKENSSLDM